MAGEEQLKVEVNKEVVGTDKEALNVIKGFLETREDDVAIKTGFKAFKDSNYDSDKFYAAYDKVSGRPPLEGAELMSFGKILTHYAQLSKSADVKLTVDVKDIWSKYTLDDLVDKCQKKDVDVSTWEAKQGLVLGLETIISENADRYPTLSSDPFVQKLQNFVKTVRTAPDDDGGLLIIENAVKEMQKWYKDEKGVSTKEQQDQRDAAMDAIKLNFSNASEVDGDLQHLTLSGFIGGLLAAIEKGKAASEAAAKAAEEAAKAAERAKWMKQLEGLQIAVAVVDNRAEKDKNLASYDAKTVTQRGVIVFNKDNKKEFFDGSGAKGTPDSTFSEGHEESNQALKVSSENKYFYVTLDSSDAKAGDFVNGALNNPKGAYDFLEKYQAQQNELYDRAIHEKYYFGEKTIQSEFQDLYASADTELKLNLPSLPLDPNGNPSMDIASFDDIYANLKKIIANQTLKEKNPDLVARVQNLKDRIDNSVRRCAHNVAYAEDLQIVMKDKLKMNVA